MNRHRRLSYQLRECIRLASYVIDESRVYSDEEIAETLGETVQWVRGMLRENEGAAFLSFIEQTFGGELPPMSWAYDSSGGKEPLWEPPARVVHMMYDAAPRGHTDGEAPRKALEDK